MLISFISLFLFSCNKTNSDLVMDTGSSVVNDDNETNKTDKNESLLNLIKESYNEDFLKNNDQTYKASFDSKIIDDFKGILLASTEISDKEIEDFGIYVTSKDITWQNTDTKIRVMSYESNIFNEEDKGHYVTFLQIINDDINFVQVISQYTGEIAREFIAAADGEKLSLAITGYIDGNVQKEAYSSFWEFDGSSLNKAYPSDDYKEGGLTLSKKDNEYSEVLDENSNYSMYVQADEKDNAILISDYISLNTLCSIKFVNGEYTFEDAPEQQYEIRTLTYDFYSQIDYDTNYEFQDKLKNSGVEDILNYDLPQSIVSLNEYQEKLIYGKNADESVQDEAIRNYLISYINNAKISKLKEYLSKTKVSNDETVLNKIGSQKVTKVKTIDNIKYELSTVTFLDSNPNSGNTAAYTTLFQLCTGSNIDLEMLYLEDCAQWMDFEILKIGDNIIVITIGDKSINNYNTATKEFMFWGLKDNKLVPVKINKDIIKFNNDGFKLSEDSKYKENCFGCEYQYDPSIDNFSSLVIDTDLYLMFNGSLLSKIDLNKIIS